MANTKPTKILIPATYTTNKSKYANFPHAVQAQSGITYQLQAEQIDGSPFDLTGYTMSGTIQVVSSTYPMTGVITITNPTAGRFTWEPESEDTAFAGTHTVQFRATLNPDDIVYSFPMNWQVSPTAEANASPASPLVGVPPSSAACLSLFCASLSSAEGGTEFVADGAGGGAFSSAAEFRPYDYSLTEDKPLEGFHTFNTLAEDAVLWDVEDAVGEGFNGYGLVGGSLSNVGSDVATLLFYDWDTATFPPDGTGLYVGVYDVAPSSIRHFAQAIVPIRDSKIHVSLSTLSAVINMTYFARLYAVKKAILPPL